MFQFHCGKKTLSLAQVFRMTEGEAETAFEMIRWADTNGIPVCPSCGSVESLRSPPREWRAPLPLLASYRDTVTLA